MLVTMLVTMFVTMFVIIHADNRLVSDDEMGTTIERLRSIICFLLFIKKWLHSLSSDSKKNKSDVR